MVAKGALAFRESFAPMMHELPEILGQSVTPFPLKFDFDAGKM
jgi:hypothetical protein